MTSSLNSSSENNKTINNDFMLDIIVGLNKNQKEIPCKWFYDDNGSYLFEQICELPEYYPTRTEVKILTDSANIISSLVKPNISLVEFGSGSSSKVKILLDALKEPYAYIPVDISREYLYSASKTLTSLYPEIKILPVYADYTQSFSLPNHNNINSLLGFFPGSTIGNFAPYDAVKFLRRIRKILGNNSNLIIGADLKKNIRTLEAAYNDSKGITAAFNKNVLIRANKELNANFVIEFFDHKAYWNESAGRIEMHLVSLQKQTVSFSGKEFFFEKGETIHTESSYKYMLDDFRNMALKAGWNCKTTWLDTNKYFSVNYLDSI